jgi:hypothetical protein
MRQKREAVLCFESNDKGLPKVVRDYRARYRAISQVLDKNPEVLDLVDRDLRKLSRGGRKGRKGDFTSENILRALIVQDMEGLPFREAVIRMGGDAFLQDFLRTRKKAVMDFTFLDKCSLAVQPETWKRVNELLELDANYLQGLFLLADVKLRKGAEKREVREILKQALNIDPSLIKQKETPLGTIFNDLLSRAQ